MKALTIHQPWAWLIAAGHKRVENRSQPTNYRGPLAIHAGLSQASIHLLDCEALRRAADLPALDELVFGAVIGTVELYDCVPFDEAPCEPNAAYDFYCGPWCWLLRDARPLSRPVPWRGSQGFFNVPLRA